MKQAFKSRLEVDRSLSLNLNIIVPNSNHMSTSQRLAVIDTSKFLPYLSSLGQKIAPPPRPLGDFSQNLIITYLSQREFQSFHQQEHQGPLRSAWPLAR